MSDSEARDLHLNKLIVSVILAALGYLGFSIWGGWQEVLTAFRQVPLYGLLLLLLLSLVNYLLRYARWHYYLTLLQHPLSRLTTLRIYIAGFALTTTPGKAGEALRGFLLKPLGVPHVRSLATLLVERFSDLLVVIILCGLGVVAYPDAWSVLLLLLPLLLLLIWLLQQRRWLEGMNRYIRARFSGRFAVLFEGLIDTLLHSGSLFTPPLLLYSIVLGLLAWGAEGVAFYYLIQLLGFELDPAMAVFIYAFAMLVGAISFLPGGLGGTEVTMTALLVLNGMGEGTAVAATVIIRLTTLWFAVALGLLALLIRRGKSV